MPTPSKEEILHQYFIKNKLTLSIAESCTGGALSARITRQAGASAYYFGGVVSYSNKLKIKVLEVRPETLLRHGAVSGEVVAEMVTGILRLTGSHYAIAISGIAGPEGGSPEKPVGTMWGAIGKIGLKPYVWQFHVEGDRQVAIDKAVDTLIKELIDFCRQKT